MCIYVCVCVCWLKNSSDDVIYAVDDILIYGIEPQ